MNWKLLNLILMFLIAFYSANTQDIKLITSEDKDISNTLKDVVFMMIPNHNPGGMNMIVDHYYKYKGTKFEGSRLPGVYHKYVGQDNNRDFMTLSQEDTKAISAITSKTWFPQVMVEKHQMGGSGVRYFIPPLLRLEKKYYLFTSKLLYPTTSVLFKLTSLTLA